ncbi:MAG: helix-turn-helix domain-containing protein [Desulfuromonadaceae bacterium]|nr:helix-turn-helix domain-containing protein [Desulfuromonadaceae bacterium]
MAVEQAGGKQKYELQLVVETFLILEKILEANDGLTLTYICKSTQITKNKAFRMLATMIQCGILEKDERSIYKIGITSIGNAHKALAKASSLDKARFMMESLAKTINEAVYFAKYTGPEAVLVDFVDCCHPIKSASFIGAAIKLPPVTYGISVAKISDITVDINGLSAEITTVSLPYGNGEGVATGALVVVAPTYRMTPERIEMEIVPALRDVVQRQQLQLNKITQERLMPMLPPSVREFAAYPHLASGRLSKSAKAAGLSA